MKLNGKTVEIGEGKLIACKFLLLNKYSFQKWKISFAEKQVTHMQQMFERFSTKYKPEAHRYILQPLGHLASRNEI
jgi:hypothetical protein